jgi:rare lipoprotein A
MRAVAAPRCGRRFASWAGLAVATLAAVGCAHKTASTPPTAPPVSQPTYPNTPTYPTQPAEPASPAPRAPAGGIAVTPMPLGGVSGVDKDFILSHRPIYSEEGEATWYTAPYKGRKAANGEIFNDEALTAAHRTLPMGSLIVVTNLVTRQASAMRISDRGPFVPGKILDLTIASARSIGIYRSGTARVRVDVYQTPKPMDTGGRWCVQIGAFTSEEKAEKLKEELLREYPDAKVIEFHGERTYWVRIRPAGDDRAQAEAMARTIQPEEGAAFLTRLD